MSKLWGIRHIRWLWLSYKLHQHIDWCRRTGLGFFVQQSDLDYLDRVWKGKE